MSFIKNCFFTIPDRETIRSVYTRQKNVHLMRYLSHHESQFKSYGLTYIEMMTWITGNWSIKKQVLNELNLYHSDDNQAAVLSLIENENDTLTKLMNHQTNWAFGSLLMGLASTTICIALPIIFGTPITSVPLIIFFISTLVLALSSFVLSMYCTADNSCLNNAIERDSASMSLFNI